MFVGWGWKCGPRPAKEKISLSLKLSPAGAEKSDIIIVMFDLICKLLIFLSICKHLRRRRSERAQTVRAAADGRGIDNTASASAVFSYFLL